MTHRRITLAVHAALIVAMLAGAAWHIAVAVTYAADPVDPWMVSPIPIFLVVAGVDLVGSALVGWGLRQWAWTGRRGPLAVGDFTGSVLVLLVPVLPPVLLVSIGVLAVVAGGCVAAAPVAGAELRLGGARDD